MFYKNQNFTIFFRDGYFATLSCQKFMRWSIKLVNKNVVKILHAVFWILPKSMDQKKNYQQVFNQFMTELHLAACVDPHSFYLSWHHFSWSRTTLSANFCRVKRSFKPYMNKHDSVKEAKAKANNHVTLTCILSWKSWFTTHLPLLSWNTFTHWNEAYYMLSKRKKWGKKTREEGWKESERKKSKLLCHF